MKSGSAIHELCKAFSTTLGNGALLCSFSLYKALAIIVFTEAFLFPMQSQPNSFSSGPQVTFYLLCALICVGAAVFLRKNNTLFSQDWYAPLVLFFILLGLMLLYLRTNANVQDRFSQGMCLYLGISFLALGFVGIHIEFGRVFGHLGTIKTLAFGIIASCIGSVLYVLTDMLSGPLRWIPAVLYAVLTVVFFRYARTVIGKSRIYSQKYEKDLRVPYRFMITSLVQGLSFGFLYGIFALADFPSRPQIEFAGMLGSAILTALTLLVAHVDFNRAIYRIGFPLIAVAMLGSGLFSGDPTAWITCQVIGFLYLDLVLWALGSYLIKDCDQPATWVAACPSAMLMVGRAVGIIAGSSIAPDQKQLALLLGGFIIVYAALLLVGERNIKTGWGFTRPGDLRSGANLGKMCVMVEKEYRLTPREGEVLRSLVEGRDAEEIARYLFISPNTVKSHIQNIYSKLEVHSRKELLRLVEGRRRLFDSQ